MTENFDFNLLSEPIHHQSSYQIEVVNAFREVVEQYADGEQVSLADTIPFEWDRVCIFNQGASNEDINRALGFDWISERDFVEEDRQVMVFVHDEQVVQHLVFRPGYIGNRTSQDDRSGLCLDRDEAVFTVESYTSQTARRVFLMLNGT